MRNGDYEFVEASMFDPICCSSNPAKSLEEAEERMKIRYDTLTGRAYYRGRLLMTKMIQISKTTWLNPDRIIGMVMLMKGEPDPRFTQIPEPVLIKDDRLLAIDYNEVGTLRICYVEGLYIGYILSTIWGTE
jgi:hypothetical protein